MVPRAPRPLNGVLVDCQTGAAIRWARWHDEKTGEYEAFTIDPKEAKKRGIPLHTILYRGRTKLDFIPDPLPTLPTTSREDRPQQKHRPQRRERCLMLADRECQEPKCHALATWSIADEEELPPVFGLFWTPQGMRRVWHERARTIGVRYYCAAHVRRPTSINQRGVKKEFADVLLPDKSRSV